MFEILLYFEIAQLINAGPDYWVIFTLICIVKIVRFFLWWFKDN